MKRLLFVVAILAASMQAQTTNQYVQVCSGTLGLPMVCQNVLLSTLQSAATVRVGKVTTLPAGSAATVTNVGTPQNAVLNFGIPQGSNGTNGIDGTNGTNGTNGKDGINGTDGAAATIAVGQVTTLPPGTSASVANSGTTTAAVFDFGIPQGVKGDTGSQGPVGPNIPGLTFVVNPDGTTALSLNGTFTTVGGDGKIKLNGLTLTCSVTGPKCN